MYAYHDIPFSLSGEQEQGATGITPHPNNPAEYCSIVPPTQAAGATAQPPPSVLVPVLKRDGKLCT